MFLVFLIYLFIYLFWDFLELFALQIQPLSGPIEGGTMVTIQGSNLGTSEEEIRDNITIGGIPCALEEYSVSVR